MTSYYQFYTIIIIVVVVVVVVVTLDKVQSRGWQLPNIMLHLWSHRRDNTSPITALPYCKRTLGDYP